MSEAPYINFYTSDFLAGTGGLTASTKGVYITILCLIYESGGPLPQKRDVLARRCGCTLPAFNRAISDLEDDGKLEVTEAGIWSSKCEKHLALRRERQSSARSAANTRWEKNLEKQDRRDATAMRAQCQPEPEPEPLKKEDTDVSLVHAVPANDISHAVKRYNDAAEKAGWPKVQKLSASRAKVLKARLSDCNGIDGWEVALRKAFQSDFCRGRTPKPWTGFGFDWLTKAANFTKLMEGNYDNRDSRPPYRPDPALAQIVRLAGLG